MCFVFQAEDGIRYLVRSRGLGDVYKRQFIDRDRLQVLREHMAEKGYLENHHLQDMFSMIRDCLLYTSDAADERSSVDLGGRRIIKKKNNRK